MTLARRITGNASFHCVSIAVPSSFSLVSNVSACSFFNILGFSKESNIFQPLSGFSRVCRVGTHTHQGRLQLHTELATNLRRSLQHSLGASNAPQNSQRPPEASRNSTRFSEVSRSAQMAPKGAEPGNCQKNSLRHENTSQNQVLSLFCWLAGSWSFLGRPGQLDLKQLRLERPSTALTHFQLLPHHS